MLTYGAPFELSFDSRRSIFCLMWFRFIIYTCTYESASAQISTKHD